MNIKDRRKELGLSQKELAESVGITSQTLCDIENGRSNPSLKTAIKISEILKVTDIDFFKG